MDLIQLENLCFRDEFGPRPGPAWPGPGLIEGHFWDLAHRGPGPFILAQVWPGPEKYGPNSTHRDEFGLHFSLARPSPAWPGPYRRSFLRLACHGLGRSILAQVWPGPEKNGPNSSLFYRHLSNTDTTRMPTHIWCVYSKYS